MRRVIWDRGFAAVATEIDTRPYGWRVAIYTADRRRLASFAPSFAINDLAFHPTAPELAIGTGEYDGGALWEGELLIWNWNTGAYRSVVTDHHIERLAYRDEGRRLVALVREGGRIDLSGASIALVGASIDLSDDPVELVTIDRNATALSPHPDEPEPVTDELAHLGFVSCAGIRDLACLPDGRLAIAYGDGCVELRSDATECELRPADADVVDVELLANAGSLFVNVITSASRPRFATRSTLYAADDSKLVLRRELAGEYRCSIDAGGRILAVEGKRTLSGRTGTDLVLRHDGSVALETDLGGYGAPPLRIDGGSGLYFLRDADQPRLFQLDDELIVHNVMPWGPDGGQANESHAVIVDGDIVRACSIYLRRDHHHEVRVERYSLPRRCIQWCRCVDTHVIAIAAISSAAAVAIALEDGTLDVLDAASGAVLHHGPIMIDGISVVVSALAVRGDEFVVGTSDGRVALLELR